MTWDPVSTMKMRELLAARHPAGEWAFMHEVAPRTGGGTRYADAVAVGLWQSRGHAVHGFEIKMSRGDWLREVRNPKKTEESVYRYCDAWWVVAPKGMVKEEEIPTTWGLLEATETKLQVKKAAPKLEAKPIDRMFFASLMRRAHEQIASIADARYAERIKTMQADIEKRIEDGVVRRTRDRQELQKAVDAFEEATGVQISRYGSDSAISTFKLAKALARMSSYGDPRPMSRLLDAVETVGKVCEQARGLIEPFVGEEQLAEAKAA